MYSTCKSLFWWVIVMLENFLKNKKNNFIQVAIFCIVYFGIMLPKYSRHLIYLNYLYVFKCGCGSSSCLEFPLGFGRGTTLFKVGWTVSSTCLFDLAPKHTLTFTICLVKKVWSGLDSYQTSNHAAEIWFQLSQC